jgi:hypothetical protein
MIMRIALFGFLISATAFSAVAQSSDLLWRVENLTPVEQVPDYNAYESPLPQQQQNPADLLPPPDFEVALSAAELAERERSRRTARLLEEIRKLMGSDNVFAPDLSGLSVNGIVQARGEFSALMQGQWVKVDDIISVPVKGVIKAYEMLGELETLDEDLAEIVGEELEDKIETASQLDLTVKEINVGTIELVGPNGEHQVLSVIPSGW